MAADRFSQRLLRWFDTHGRKDLPWQSATTPYRVWVSEIMLQQTQVATVVPYYHNFMRRFPTIDALASASVDDVLAHWSGLGYYARARNLHKAAVKLAHEHDGKFPDTVDALEQLPGIGRSTAGAIVSLAYRKRAVILDGNVKRVLARFHAVRGAIDDARTLEKLWQLADGHTPHKRVNDYTQAIMDLGATLCTRTKPRCDACPMTKECAAFHLGTPEKFPRKKTRIKVLPERETAMLVIVNPASEVLLQQRPAKGIWGGLWSLPEVRDESEARAWCRTQLGERVTAMEELESIVHTFSHFRLHIQPLVIRLKRAPAPLKDDRLQWCDPAQQRSAKRKGMAAPVSRLLDSL